MNEVMKKRIEEVMKLPLPEQLRIFKENLPAARKAGVLNNPKYPNVMERLQQNDKKAQSQALMMVLMWWATNTSEPLPQNFPD